MQKFRSFFSSYVFIVSTISSLSCVIPGIAQVDRSGLTGTVTDPSGQAAGPNAHHCCRELDPVAA